MRNPRGITRKKRRQAEELLQGGQLRRAGALYAQVCKIDPRDAEAWTALAMIHGELGDYREAERDCRRALNVDPQLGRAHYVLAKSLKALGDLPSAIVHFERALALKAGGAELYNDLGNALREDGRPEQALDCFVRAVDLRPDYVRALFNLGHVRRLLGQPDEAAQCYRRALELEPANAGIHYVLAVAHSAQGRLEEALHHYREVLALEPDHTDAVAGIARVYEKRGDYEAAYEQLRPHLPHTRSPGVAVAYAGLAPRFGHHREAVALMEALLVDKSLALGPEQSRGLRFQLGKLYDAMGRCEQAFRHYDQGNRLKAVAFDAPRHVAAIDTLIEGYTASALSRAASASVSSGRPVFIVGMPRSGTTLVEQILAAHPDVHGGGELYEMERLACRLPTLPGKRIPDPERVKALTAVELDGLARAYLQCLDGLGGREARITDKMPYNFLHLGLLGMLFPGARVIHCVRDPLDTCLSCYFQDFEYGNSYTFDLGHLGLYYRQYRRLMDHWKEVGAVPLLEVRYEDLVADPEAVSRTLVEFCDLSWDDACLRFYEHDRVVNTASYDQVRRPVYASSVGRWRRYESFIAPLREALE